MDELESLIEELQSSVKKVVSSPPANYVRVHEWPASYNDGFRESDSSIFRENMSEIERLLGQLDEPDDSQVVSGRRSSACPSITLESLMNDLKEFQDVALFLKTVELELEHDLTLSSRVSARGSADSSGHSPPVATVAADTAVAAAASLTGGSSGSAAASPNSKALGDDNSVGATRCAGCREQILGQMVQALGRAWHIEHFQCAGCRSELGRQTFYEMSGRAFCEPCYQAEFSPKCAQCGGPILDRCITALGRQWHPEHFFCQGCTAPFSETCGFHERDGRPYCLDCYSDAFSPKCRGCGAAITANYVTAMDKMWHPECFVCKDCGRDLGGGGGNFYELSGKPYCEQHYHAGRGTLCITCDRPVASRWITAMGRKFHPECFLCAFCNNQLSRGTFKEKESKPYCSGCFAKLFFKA